MSCCAAADSSRITSGTGAGWVWPGCGSAGCCSTRACASTCRALSSCLPRSFMPTSMSMPGVSAGHGETLSSGRQLPADLGQRPLLLWVEDRERRGHALGVLGEQAVHDLLAAGGETDGGGAPVVLEPAADHEPAGLERRDDLGRVGLRGAQAVA